MADQKISQLTSYTPPIPTDVFPIVDITNGATKKITVGNLTTYIAALSETLTNKTLTSPTIATILNGAGTLTLPTTTDTLVGRATTDTLTNKTLTSPVINVGSDATGDIYYRSSGILTRLAVGGANTLLHGGTIPAYSAVVEGDITLADVTTLDVSTTKHGFVPKAPNDTSKVLRGDATWAVVSASALLGSVTTAVTSPTSTVETALLTQSIPANTLSTNKGVKVTIFFDGFTMTSNGNFTFRFKYGSTTLVTVVIGSATITSGTGILEFILLAKGATNSQAGSARLLATPDGTATGSVITSFSGSGTSAEDSTGALNLIITTQSQNTGTLSGIITMETAIVEKLG